MRKALMKVLTGNSSVLLLYVALLIVWTGCAKAGETGGIHVLFQDAPPPRMVVSVSPPDTGEAAGMQPAEKSVSLHPIDVLHSTPIAAPTRPARQLGTAATASSQLASATGNTASGAIAPGAHVAAAVTAAGIPVPAAASGTVIVHFVKADGAPSSKKPAAPRGRITTAASAPAVAAAYGIGGAAAAKTAVLQIPASAPRPLAAAAKLVSPVVSTTKKARPSTAVAAAMSKSALVLVANAPRPPLLPAFAPNAAPANYPTPATMPPLELAGPSVKPPAPFIFKQKGATKTVKVGCCVPFEGSQKSAGEAVFSAMKMAVTDMAATELPGVNVNLTCLNSKCKPVPAYMAVNQFADEGAVAVIGDICSSASVAAAGVASQRKLPVVSPASTSPSLSQIDYFFRTVPSDKFQGQAAASLVCSKGVRHIAMVAEDNAYGYGLAFNFIAAFTKAGGTVPVVYQFKAGQGDSKAAVAQIKQGMQGEKVNGVFISTSNLTFAADLLAAAKTAGITVPIYAGDAAADYTLFQGLRGRPSVLANLTVLSIAPGTPAFVKAFSKFTGTNATASYQAYAAHAYDATIAVMKAYKAALPPKDGPAIKQQLQKEAFKGVSGAILFDANGDLILDNRTYVYLKFNTTSGDHVVKGFA